MKGKQRYLIERAIDKELDDLCMREYDINFMAETELKTITSNVLKLVDAIQKSTRKTISKISSMAVSYTIHNDVPEDETLSKVPEESEMMYA